MKDVSRQTVLLLVFIVMGGTAFGAWQFVLSPLKSREENINRLQEELDKKEKERDTIVLDLRLNERAQRQMSLPADQSLAINEYGKLLQNLLLHSKLQVRDFKPGQPDSRNAPLLANKKPAYTRLSYSIQVRGDLYSLVEFMYGLYRQPLLHQIRKINIQVPQAGANARAAKSEELEVTMTIEALIIDKAENRPTLFSIPASMGLVAGGIGATGWNKFPVKNQGYGSPFSLASALARDEDDELPSAEKKHQTWKHPPIAQEYLRIAGKNIFTGPGPVAPKELAGQQEKDFSPFIKLNEITTDSDGHSQASIRNLMLKYDYTVTQSANGEMRVSTFYYINKTTGEHTVTVKKSYGSNSKGKFEFGDESKGNRKEFVILRLVDNSDILIQTVEDHDRHQAFQKAISMVLGGSAPALFPGRVYRWHLGQSLSEAVEGKMGPGTDENGEEQQMFVKAEPLRPYIARAAMVTLGAFPENLPDPRAKAGLKGVPKKNGRPR